MHVVPCLAGSHNVGCQGMHSEVRCGELDDSCMVMLQLEVWEARWLMVFAPQDDIHQREALRAYTVTSPKVGIIGSSRYAKRLRSQIVKASQDPARFNHHPFRSPMPSRLLLRSPCEKPANESKP